MNNLDINFKELTFLKGELVDLISPVDDPNLLGIWASWFNNPDTTMFIAQGTLVNNRITQKKYLDSILNDPTRLTLLIKPKKINTVIGVASLSLIDNINKECHFSMIIGKKLDTLDSVFFGMETKALLTEHAFEKLGMNRINSGQVIELLEWQRWQILFGFQIEGILREKFVKGHAKHDLMISSCIYRDYKKIITQRGGKLWPGKKNIYKLLKSLPTKSLIHDLHEWLTHNQEKYFKSVNS